MSEEYCYTCGQPRSNTTRACANRFHRGDWPRRNAENELLSDDHVENLLAIKRIELVSIRARITSLLREEASTQEEIDRLQAVMRDQEEDHA